MRLKRGVFFLLIATLVLLGSCSKHDKLVKGTNAELQYTTALELYEKGKYRRAQELLERCSNFYRVTKRADTVGFYLANCYFHLHDYVLAGYGFNQVYEVYPRSVFAEEAMFMSAYSLFKASPRPDLDQAYTKKSINGFELFLQTYPNSDRKVEANKWLKELYNKLLTKEYKAAKMYYHQRNYRASVQALRSSLEKYPTTPYREEQLYMLAKSSYLLAKNSIEAKKKTRYQHAVDDYLSFVSEFPESKYGREASGYYEKSMRILGQEPNPDLIR